MQVKILIISSMALVCGLAHAAPFTTPARIPGTKHLYRGAQPIGHPDVLTKSGIDVVVIFKNDTKGEVKREKDELTAEGTKRMRPFVVHHIPMEWKQIDSKRACEQTIQALTVLLAAEKAGANAYVHCTAGEDRTGMVSGLARMLLNGETTDKIFADELCENGYSDGGGKPN
ncbi:MAG: tyrosine-protein phosphatase [Bdellovibrionota bacterium]